MVARIFTPNGLEPADPPIGTPSYQNQPLDRSLAVDDPEHAVLTQEQMPLDLIDDLVARHRDDGPPPRLDGRGGARGDEVSRLELARPTSGADLGPLVRRRGTASRTGGSPPRPARDPASCRRVQLADSQTLSRQK